jgi:membrane fusion protein (multidrug efflux system)
MRNPFFVFLVILMTCFASCKTEDKKQDAASQASGAKPAGGGFGVGAVEGYLVRPTLLTETVNASGTIMPDEETELHPEAAGRVVSINLPEGRSVRKGELLLKIFDEDLKTQLRKLESQIKQAEITEQRLGELLKVKGVSQQEYDLAALQVLTLKSDLDLIKINLSRTELRAPYDGVLGLRNISPGAYVSPATAVTTIRSSGGLKLDFSVPEKYSEFIRPGLVLDFSVEGNSKSFKAKVLATSQGISADTRNLAARAQVLGDSRGLLPGAYAEVSLALGQNTAALMVPTQAIIPQARDKKLIVCRNGKAQMVAVKTGVRQAGLVEVTEGIKTGDTVATTGILFLRPDMPMTFSVVR